MYIFCNFKFSIIEEITSSWNIFSYISFVETAGGIMITIVLESKPKQYRLFIKINILYSKALS